METIFITVHDLTPDARIRYCSDSIEDILGYLPHEVKGKSCWDFFHPKELPFARSIHGRGIELDKAAVLNYCRLKHRDGSWIGCECVFTIVYDVLVASTSVYKKGHRARQRALDGAGVRRVFSSSPRDPRYHMLAYLSNKFYQEPQAHTREPRAALFLNRFTRTSTIMFATNSVADILGVQSDKLIGKSFYFCIAENCLREAIKCLESAKANDSIAYLRFWFRDPLQPEPRGPGDGMVDGEESDEDEDGGVSIPTDQSANVDIQNSSIDQSRKASVPSIEVDGNSGGLVDGADRQDHDRDQPDGQRGRQLDSEAGGQVDGHFPDHISGSSGKRTDDYVDKSVDGDTTGRTRAKIDGQPDGYFDKKPAKHDKSHAKHHTERTTYGGASNHIDGRRDGEAVDGLDSVVDGELAQRIGRVPKFEAEEQRGTSDDLFSRLMPSSSDHMHHSVSRSESEAAFNTRSSSGESTDLGANATDAIFDPPTLQRSHSSNTPQDEEAPIEIEAVVSCTSDGLVVILRRARPLVPHVLESTSDTPYFANGLFASPWANDPIMPKDIPQATVQPTLSFPPMNNPAEAGFMTAIRDVAVFAWSLTGINGSLAQYSRGRPSGDALPPGGFPVWDPNSGADPENVYNGFLGSLHRPFEGMGEPSVVKKDDDSNSSDEEILWKRVPTMPTWRRPQRRGHQDAFGADGDAPVDGEGSDGGRKKPLMKPS